MKLQVEGIEEGQPIPEKFAFGVYSEDDHMSFGPNRNPEVVWDGAPEGTKSFVVMMFDPDVPSVADDVNQEGKTVSRDIPRVDFFHWLLVDVPAGTTRIPEGEDSDGVIPKGKEPGPGPIGIRGVNNYTQFLAGNPTPGTMVPVRPGAMRLSITTTSRCMHWMWIPLPWMASSMVTMCAKPWQVTYWPAPG